MRKQYEELSKSTPKDMSKAISDMTYTYINPETGEPTKVPASHYENILNQVVENYMSDITSKQFLNIMYTQLCNLKKEDKKYFNQALICMDLGIKPKELRISEQIAIEYINDYIENKKEYEKKSFHMLSNDIISEFETLKNDKDLQSSVIRESNYHERKEQQNFNHKDYER